MQKSFPPAQLFLLNYLSTRVREVVSCYYLYTNVPSNVPSASSPQVRFFDEMQNSAGPSCDQYFPACHRRMGYSAGSFKPQNESGYCCGVEARSRSGRRSAVAGAESHELREWQGVFSF